MIFLSVEESRYRGRYTRNVKKKNIVRTDCGGFTSFTTQAQANSEPSTPQVIQFTNLFEICAIFNLFCSVMSTQELYEHLLSTNELDQMLPCMLKNDQSENRKLKIGINAFHIT